MPILCRHLTLPLLWVFRRWPWKCRISNSHRNANGIGLAPNPPIDAKLHRRRLCPVFPPICHLNRCHNYNQHRYPIPIAMEREHQYRSQSASPRRAKCGVTLCWRSIRREIGNLVFQLTVGPKSRSSCTKNKLHAPGTQRCCWGWHTHTNAHTRPSLGNKKVFEHAGSGKADTWGGRAAWKQSLKVSGSTRFHKQIFLTGYIVCNIGKATHFYSTKQFFFQLPIQSNIKKPNIVVIQTTPYERY